MVNNLRLPFLMFEHYQNESVMKIFRQVETFTILVFSAEEVKIA